MLTLQFYLKRDRQVPGIVTAIKDGVAALSGRCLGKSDNLGAARHGNPDRNPVKDHGDTPTGEFKIIRLHDMGPQEAHSYGPQAIMDLDGVAGQALEAYKNGREGIAIHGGVLGAGGALRPTFGCLRVDNDTQVKLLALVNQEGIANVKVVVEEV